MITKNAIIPLIGAMIKNLKNRSIFAFAFILLQVITRNANATYYTITSGAPTSLTLWWTGTNGNGTTATLSIRETNGITIQTATATNNLENYTHVVTLSILLMNQNNRSDHDLFYLAENHSLYWLSI